MGHSPDGMVPRRGEWRPSLLPVGGRTICRVTFTPEAHLEIHLSDAESFFEVHDGLAQFGLLTVTNPGRVIQDQLPLPVPPLRIREGLWDRFAKIFTG